MKYLTDNIHPCPFTRGQTPTVLFYSEVVLGNWSCSPAVSSLQYPYGFLSWCPTAVGSE